MMGTSPLRIVQCNTNRSQVCYAQAVVSAFDNKVDLLLVQEPPITSFNKLPARLSGDVLHVQPTPEKPVKSLIVNLNSRLSVSILHQLSNQLVTSVLVRGLGRGLIL